MYNEFVNDHYKGKRIEVLINLINLAYCAIKILPYQEDNLSKYDSESV